MKNKVLAIIVLSMIILIIGSVSSQAKVVTNDPTVNSGDTVTINITSQDLVDGYKISISNNSGLTFLSATGGTYASGQTVSGVNPSGMTSLATYKFKAPDVTKDTTYKVTFSLEGVIPHGTEEKKSDSTTSTITVKAKPTTPSGGGSTGGNNGGSTTKPTPTEPKFTSASKTVYTQDVVNLRASWSKTSSAVTVPKGTELKLTGTSTEKVNGYVWYRVTYNGQTKYVSRDLIAETNPNENKDEEKSNNTNLKTLSIKDVKLTPEFSANVTEYSVELINYKEETLNITAEAEDNKSTVKIEGNEQIKLDENVILITVTAEDGTTKIYTITVTNKEEEALGLSSLTIKGIELKDFSPSKFNYEIEFKDLDKLEIEAIANEEGATVEIIDNENLLEGENIIRIIVTSADGQQIATYQIKANKLAVTEQKQELNIKVILICAAIALVVLIIIILLVVKYIKGNSDVDIDYVYNDNLENKYETEENEEDKNNEIQEEKQDNVKEEIEENKKPTVDDLYSAYDDTDTKKRGRGKHSK